MVQYKQTVQYIAVQYKHIFLLHIARTVHHKRISRQLVINTKNCQVLNQMTCLHRSGIVTFGFQSDKPWQQILILLNKIIQIIQTKNNRLKRHKTFV